MRKLTFYYILFCMGFAMGQTDSITEIRQLRSDIQFLASDLLEGRESGTKGELIAAEYIASRYQALGLLKKGDDESYFQDFSKKTKAHPHDTEMTGPVINGRNVIGYMDKNAKNTIVIGAHYDHLGWGAEGSLHDGDSAIHNGADDNASGISAMLFLAKRLSNEDLNTNFLFIAFSGEEKGLLGSNYFVHNPTIDLESVTYMINMDMVGRLDTNRRLAVYGVGTSDVFIPTINSIEYPHFEFQMDSSGVGPSDHTSFYLNDIPVLHFFTGQHHEYHKPADDIELINFDGLYDVSVFIEEIIDKLNNEGKLSFQKTRDDKQGKRQSKFKVTLGIMPDYLFDGKGLKIDGVKEGGAGAKAGIQKGDIIVQMGDLPINSMHDYMNALGTLDKGDTVKVKVIRDGKTETLKVHFEKEKNQE